MQSRVQFLVSHLTEAHIYDTVQVLRSVQTHSILYLRYISNTFRRGTKGVLINYILYDGSVLLQHPQAHWRCISACILDAFNYFVPKMY